MANQTVTTGTIAAPINYDDPSISNLLNGESITINGGAVRIDSDVRWNQQAAVFGNLTLSASLGGALMIDGRDVWEVPFSASTGTVPTQNALGANGVTGGTSGATGELLRVWATGSLDPAAAGGAMPATGWTKLRSKTGTFQNGETITLPGGATITASGPGKRSWIHVVGAAGSSITVSRLSTFWVDGDWYELGTTNGLDNQTFQYPVADGCPAIWIETGVGSGVYEVWLNGGPGTASLWSTTDSRGKFFVCAPATGIITLAQRGGANNGLRPAAGLRVRIPNVLMSSSSSANWNANIGSTADPTTLYTFSASSTGSISLGYISSNWYIRAADSYGLSLTNSGVACGVTITNVKTSPVLNNVGIGVYSSTAQIYGLTLTGQFAGASLTDVFVTRFTFVPNSVCFDIINGQNINLTRLRVLANCPFPFRVQGADTVAITDFAGVRSGGNIIGSCTNVTITNPAVSHQLTGISTGVSFGSSFDISNCADLFIDGFAGTFGNVAATNSVNGLYNLTGCNRVEIRNIGTVATPLNMFFGGAIPTRNAVILVRCADVVLRRIYVTPSTSSYNAVDMNTDSRNVELINVWSLTNTLNLSAANTLARGSAVGAGTTMALPATVGTHWGDTFNAGNVNTGVIQLAMNEPTAQSSSQVAATLNAAAGSGFTGSGSVLMKHASDQIIAEMPYYCLGISGFAATAPTITATNSANHVFEFQYDLGTGYNGAWLALTGANLSAITVNPAVGVKLKIRVTVAVAATTNSFSAITISTVTNATNRQTQYPLPTNLNMAEVTNIVAGSRLRVYNVTTATEITNQVIAGTSWSLEYAEGSSFTEGDTIQIRVRQPGYLPYQATAIAGETGWALFVSQTADDIYSATTPLNTTIDYVNLKIRATGARASFSATELVDIIRAGEATIDGIRLERFAEITGLVELSAGIFTAITVELLGWQVSWAAGSVTQATLTGGNIVGGIAGDPVEDVVGGPQITVQQSADATVVTVGSGVLPGDITAIAAAVRAELTVEMNRIDVAVSSRLAAASYTAAPSAASNASAVLAAAQATPIYSNTKQMNDATVYGTGAPGDLWRGTP